MALSGTLTGTCDNTSYKLTCEWSATQSITNNTSTITAKVYLVAPSGWSTDSDYWDCTINHITLSSRWPVDLNVMGEAIQLLECEVGLPQRLSKNKQTKQKTKKHTQH